MFKKFFKMCFFKKNVQEPRGGQRAPLFLQHIQRHEEN